ncbi:hypothetical protein [Micromonospora aurantiaca (nom. illeg.)]|uniref:hypothetical protein n=1 Tax=Micromonospora aurantiaca (nom. illeg.) TaxID=47850 RepID=UPI00340DAF5F
MIAPADISRHHPGAATAARAWRFPAFAAGPALTAAVLGLAHPHHLTADTAPVWLVLHIVLLFVFPVIAVGPISVVRQAAVASADRRLLRRAATSSAVVYAVCYGTLDVLAGIGAGSLVDQGVGAGEQDRAVLVLQKAAEPFGAIGGVALLCLVCIAGYAVWKVAGQSALPGSLLVVVGAWGLMHHHIYWPTGTLTMLCFAAGVAMLGFHSQPAVV